MAGAATEACLSAGTFTKQGTRPRPGRHGSTRRRWLLSTHQGSAGDEHLQDCLDEFTFGFNRKKSRSRGMLFYRVLELAVGHPPVRYRDLVVDPSPKKAPPEPPLSRGHPPSLDRSDARRSWRQARVGPLRRIPLRAVTAASAQAHLPVYREQHMTLGTFNTMPHVPTSERRGVSSLHSQKLAGPAHVHRAGEPEVDLATPPAAQSPPRRMA